LVAALLTRSANRTMIPDRCPLLDFRKPRRKQPRLESIRRSINDHLWDRRFIKSILRNAERSQVCVLPLLYKKAARPPSGLPHLIR
jgi:hypothetical protein